MNGFFQVLDVTTGNVVTEFQSEDEAVEALSGVQVDDGDEPILELALFHFLDGRPTLVAKERDLVVYLARARQRRGLRVMQDGKGSPQESHEIQTTEAS